MPGADDEALDGSAGSGGTSDAGLDADASKGGAAGMGGAKGGAAGHGGSCSGDGQPCTTEKLGPCAPGLTACVGDVLVCQQTVFPSPEQCNGIDDDCDGLPDNGDPGGGQGCSTGKLGVCATGTTHCLSGAIACVQDKQPGPEKCNNIDNNCNGILNYDCDTGVCNPNLLVTGSTPSDPNCIDFPIGKGSTGNITYPCAGGAVSAVLGGVTMTGSVAQNQCSLTGVSTGVGPDGCTWQFDHAISGNLSTGVLSYYYEEHVIGGSNCWMPCTETGTVAVQFPP